MVKKVINLGLFVGFWFVVMVLIPVSSYERVEELGISVMIGGVEYVYSMECGKLVEVEGCTLSYGISENRLDYYILHKEWRNMLGWEIGGSHYIRRW